MTEDEKVDFTMLMDHINQNTQTGVKPDFDDPHLMMMDAHEAIATVFGKQTYIQWCLGQTLNFLIDFRDRQDPEPLEYAKNYIELMIEHLPENEE